MERKYRRSFQIEEGSFRTATIEAAAEIHKIGGNGFPYLAITGEIREGGKWTSCGRIDDDIYKHIPELRRYLPWNLTSINQPLHYIQNCRYWAMFTVPWVPKETPAIERRKHLYGTMKYGMLDDDWKVVPEEMGDEELVAWLKERHPALMQVFYSDMGTLFGEEFYSLLGTSISL